MGETGKYLIRERLVIDYVPMKDVELVVTHGIQVFIDGSQWKEVSRGIDQNSSELKPWKIYDSRDHERRTQRSRK